MKNPKNIALFLLRILIGWHFLYEGLVKLLTPGWSSQSYLEGSYGFFSQIFQSMAANPQVVQVIDVLNIWGLILIGTGLFLGILIRLSALSGILLLLLYYFAYPPFGIGSHNFSQEGHYWIVNRNLIECLVLSVIFFSPVRDFSLLNIFRNYREKVGENAIPDSEVNGRREVIKGLVTLPFFGGIFYSAARAASMDITDANTGATMVIKTYDIKDLKGTLPKGKIGDTLFSRMIMGCNLIGGWAHSRDLIYSSSLFKHYNTEKKIFETWSLAEQAGIDTTNLTLEMYDFFNKYKRIYGSNMKSIAQLHVVPEGPDRLVNFKKCVDMGGTSLYIQGNTGDKLAKEQRLDLIQEAVEYTRSQGLLAGIGGHDILTCITCDNAGIKPDYYFKTMHHDRYWSASPLDYRQNFGVIGSQSNVDHNAIHDNMWDLFPEKTIEFFSKCNVPFIGFKVMAAGAIRPKDAFKYAFENGADFICVGMFDFQVIEDVNIVTEILNSELKRKRPWYS